MTGNLVLSKDEFTEIDILRTAGVLEEIRGEMVLGKNTVFVPCADGHCFQDLYASHVSHCCSGMHHPLALNGGALLIPHDSPLLIAEDGRRHHDDLTMQRHLTDALRLKRPELVVLYAHAPCGMARMYNLSIVDEFELLTAAKARVKEWIGPFGTIEVQVRFHVTYSYDRRRSYHFKKPAWIDYRQRQQAAA